MISGERTGREEPDPRRGKCNQQYLLVFLCPSRSGVSRRFITACIAGPSGGLLPMKEGETDSLGLLQYYKHSKYSLKHYCYSVLIVMWCEIEWSTGVFSRIPKLSAASGRNNYPSVAMKILTRVCNSLGVISTRGWLDFTFLDKLWKIGLHQSFSNGQCRPEARYARGTVPTENGCLSFSLFFLRNEWHVGPRYLFKNARRRIDHKIPDWSIL